jgi:glycosyltransferase involved in cell wall biosynthesis
MNKLSVIMPALNEEANIREAVTGVLKALGDLGIDGEVLIVNDGSTDKTQDIAQGLMVENSGKVFIVRHEKPKGIGASFWDGVDQARGDVVVMMPGDNENDPFEVLRYFKLLADVDMVVPFPLNKGNRSFSRNVVSFLFRSIINMTFCVNFNYTNGTILYRKSLLKQLSSRSYGFFYQADILIRLVKQGYLFAEVPYKINARKGGVSKALSLKSFLNVTKGYLKLVKDYYFSFNRKSLFVDLCDDSQTKVRKDDHLG